MSKYFDNFYRNTENRMKNFFTYLLMGILLFVFVDILSFGYIYSTYKPIEQYEIAVTTPNVTVEKAKTTNVNGFVKGEITNNGITTIANQYLKFDFYSERDVKVGTKYLKLENIQQDEQQEYKVQYKFDNVQYFTVNMATQEEVDNAQEFELKIDESQQSTLLISGILLLMFL
jgi:hypothetical protein